MRKLLLSVISIFLILNIVANAQTAMQNSGPLSSFATHSDASSSMSQSSSTASQGSAQENTTSGTGQEEASALTKSLEKKFKGTQASKVEKRTSSIESGFFLRTKAYHIRLRQFGYNFFFGRVRPALSIPVSKSYILGPGDEIFLYVIGNPPGINLSNITHLAVDREGKIYMPGLGVFYVWGMTLGEAEKVISKSIGANIKLTVGRLRTFPVYVSGEVRRPGAVVVTGANTVIDAIMMAGGIQRSGTLRDVIVTRKTSRGLKRIHIDFYKILLEGKPIDMKLKDGDVIFVKSIGKVAGIAGKVKKPAIYELKGCETVENIIKMAGGLLPSSYKYKVIIQRYKDNQFLKVLEGSLNDKKFTSQKVKDGDIISIKSVINIPENAVTVSGYTAYPGIYKYQSGMKLSELLKPDLFFVDSNMKFGLIGRNYPLGSQPKFITFAPEDILNGKVDLKLKPSDKIVLYRFGETQTIDFNKIKDAFVVEGEIKYPGVYAYKKGMKLSDIFTSNMLKINTDLYYAEVDRRDSETLDIVKIKKFAPIDILKEKSNIEIHRLDVIKFYPRYVYPPVEVTGLIKKSYYVPYHDGLKLSEALSSAKFTDDIKKFKVDIFRKAPKMKSSESLQRAENIKLKPESGKKVIRQNVASVFLYDLLIKEAPNLNITLNPGDSLVIQKVKPRETVEKGSVVGYVKNPGVFKINDKTTLYDVLKADGGFRKNAYPKGIVILRKSVRKMQKRRITKATALMKQELGKEEAGVMQSELTKEELRARQVAFESQKRILSEMGKTQVTGRISGVVVPYNLEKFKNSPYNILLEDGDRIYIPKKPGSVLVFGEIYNSSAYVYRKGMAIKDYISLAGGLTRDADIKNIFIIKANGAAVSSQSKNSLIAWNSEHKRFIWGGDSNSILDNKLQPGDAIIVPTKVQVPVMWRPLIRDVTQILYQSAVTIYTVTNL